MHKTILALLGATALAAPAAAQHQAGDRITTRAEVETQVREQFHRLDSDRDGFVTQAEALAVRGAMRGQRREQRQQSRDARFVALDANRDGAVSREEFLAPRERVERSERRGRRHARRGGRDGGFGGLIARADSDRDGRISLAEAVAARLERFQRMDADNDGRVTADERRAAWSARRAETR